MKICPIKKSHRGRTRSGDRPMKVEFMKISMWFTSHSWECVNFSTHEQSSTSSHSSRRHHDGTQKSFRKNITNSKALHRTFNKWFSKRQLRAAHTQHQAASSSHGHEEMWNRKNVSSICVSSCQKKQKGEESTRERDRQKRGRNVNKYLFSNFYFLSLSCLMVTFVFTPTISLQPLRKKNLFSFRSVA